MGVNLRKDGRNEVRRRWPDGTTFRRVAPNKAEAQRLDTLIKAAIFRGQKDWQDLRDDLSGSRSSNNLTMAGLWEKYLIGYAPDHMKPRSIERYATSWKTIEPELGHVPVRFVTRSQVHEYISKRRSAGISPATINRDVALIRALLTYALEELRIIAEHPLYRFKTLPVQEEEKRIPTVAELAAFVGSIRRMDPVLAVMMMFISETALRRQECFDLCRQHVDKVDRILTVTGDTKSGKTRHVPLSPEAVSQLDQLVPSIRPDNVFVHPRKKSAYRKALVQYRLEKAQKETALPWFGFHTLRHYAISKWVKSGIDLYEVQRMAGHADIRTTMRYTHLMPDFGLKVKGVDQL